VALVDLEGKIAKRTLLPGRYVPVNALRDAYLVEKGAAVEMVFVAGGLTISAGAVTLQPGSAGDQVKVRNIDSGKILSGTVMADGTIRVGGT
jgi:flagella basal body P-ring formation protein FlgA